MASLQDYLREIGGTQDVRAESLLRNLASYSANLEAGKALGVPETGKPKRGLLSKTLSVLGIPGRLVQGAILEATGQATPEMEKVSGLEEVRQLITGELQTGFGGLPGLKVEKGDNAATRIGKLIGAFALDTATDPLSYVGAPTLFSRKQAAEQLARVGGNLLDDVVRNSAKGEGVVSDLVGRSSRGRLAKIQDELALAADPNTPLDILAKQGERQVAQQELGVLLANALEKGGRREVIRTLEGLTGSKSTALKLFSQLPEDIRAGIVLTGITGKPLKNAAGEYVRITQGTGQALGPLGDLANRIRLKTAATLSPALAPFQGQRGVIRTGILKSLDREASDVTKGAARGMEEELEEGLQAASSDNWLDYISVGEADVTRKMTRTQLQGKARAVEALYNGKRKQFTGGDLDAFETSAKDGFFAPQVELDVTKMTAAQRSGYQAGRELIRSLNDLRDEAIEAGVEVGDLGVGYSPLVLSDKAYAARQKLGKIKSEGNLFRTERGRRMFVEYDVRGDADMMKAFEDPNNPGVYFANARGANEILAKRARAAGKSEAEIADAASTFIEDPVMALQRYANSMVDRISNKRFVDRLVQSGTLVRSAPKMRRALEQWEAATFTAALDNISDEVRRVAQEAAADAEKRLAEVVQPSKLREVQAKILALRTSAEAGVNSARAQEQEALRVLDLTSEAVDRLYPQAQAIRQRLTQYEAATIENVADLRRTERVARNARARARTAQQRFDEATSPELFSTIDPQAAQAQLDAARLARESLQGVPSAPVKPAQKFVSAKTGEPVEGTFFRGSGGREADGSPLRGTGEESILGPGLYGAVRREYAEDFATDLATGDVVGEVTSLSMRLDNPLVISTDEQWRALTRRAGWEFPVIERYATTPEQIRQQILSLRKLIEDGGYDGVVIKIPNKDKSTLDQMFGGDQIVAFNPRKATTPAPAAAPAMPTARPVARTPEQQQLLRTIDEQAAAEADLAAARGTRDTLRTQEIETQISAITSYEQAVARRNQALEAVQEARNARTQAVSNFKTAREGLMVEGIRSVETFVEGYMGAVQRFRRYVADNPITPGMDAATKARIRAEAKALKEAAVASKQTLRKTLSATATRFEGAAKEYADILINAVDKLSDDQFNAMLVLASDTKIRQYIDTITSGTADELEVMQAMGDMWRTYSSIADLLPASTFENLGDKQKKLLLQGPLGQLYGNLFRTEKDPGLLAERLVSEGFESLNMGKGMEELYATSGVAKLLRKMYDTERAPQGWQRFIRDTIDPLLNLWKLSVTIGRGPGYTTQNLVGGLWMNHMGDVSMQDHKLMADALSQINGRVRAIAKANPDQDYYTNIVQAEQEVFSELNKIRIGDKGLGEVVDELFKRGAFFDTEMQAASQQIAKLGSDAPAAAFRKGDPLGKYYATEAQTAFERNRRRAIDALTTNRVMKFLGDKNQLAEMYLRGAAFIDGYRRYGDFGAAMNKVHLLHFNYQDLGEGDLWAKRIMPFYTWTRNNVPVQLRAMVLQPGKIQRAITLNEEFQRTFGAEGDDSWLQQVLPEYMTIAGGVATKFKFGDNNIGTYMRLPFNDVDKLLTERGTPRLRELAGMTGPFTTPIEVASGVNLQTGEKFSGAGERVPEYYNLFRFLPGANVYRDKEGSTRIDAGYARGLGDLIPQLGLVERAASVVPGLNQVLSTESQRDRALTNFLNLTGIGAAGFGTTTLTPTTISGELGKRIEKQRGELARTAARANVDLDWVREQLRSGLTPEEVQALIRAGEGRIVTEDQQSTLKPATRSRYLDILEGMG